MPDQAIKQAAAELHGMVIALTELLEREYPKRSEVEDNFISKEGQSKRWALVLAIVLLATSLSFMGTVATISTCFLQGEVHPTACNYLPGYPETNERNKVIIEEFRRLQEVTKINSARLDELESQR